MVARAASRGVLALLGSILLIVLAARAPAQCVGDCAGDGEVTISDLILGVNIALGNQPVSACPAFANAQGEVDIAELIQGVNNALDGCPPQVATATATDTAIAATSTATATQPGATATATEVGATPTATGIPTGTAIATLTPTASATQPATTATATEVGVTPTATGVPTGTATATLAPTASATQPTATATEVAATPTATGIPIGTATATLAPATATAPPPDTVTPLATATNTALPTATATSAPSATPTETAVPPGDQIASRAAFISAGLGSIQSLVAAVVTAATNDGPPPLALALVGGLPPPIKETQCPIGGTTTQSCTEMGSFPSKSIDVVLGASNCVASGPLGGTGEFNGSIGINSNPGIVNSCSPLAFLNGAYDVADLTVVLRDATTNIALTVSADLNGDLSITGVSASCLVGSLSFSVNGTMSSILPDGSGVQVDFFDTTVMMSGISYSSDCVPLAYTLKFNGDAEFTPLQGALLEVSSPLVSGVPPAGQPFDVTFTNFILTQDATTSPVTVEMDGTMSSSCFGGQLILDTLTPLAVAAGQLCPNAGLISVTGDGDSMATVSYDNGMVTVTPEGGQATDYPSCLAPELLMCVLQ